MNYIRRRSSENCPIPYYLIQRKGQSFVRGRGLVVRMVWLSALAGMTIMRFCASPSVASAEIQVVSAPANYAPLDLAEGSSVAKSLSPKERRELVKEFEGILSMAVRKYSYASWPGRSMSDCLRNGQEGAYECELITPQSHAYYTFYGSEERAAILKKVTVNLSVADTAAVDDLARSVAKLLGRGERSDSGWLWNSNPQQAKLFLDPPAKIEDPLPLHFVWTR